MKLAAAIILLALFQDRPADDSKRGGILRDVNLHDLTAHVQRATKKTILWTEDLNLRNRRAYYATDKPVGDDPVLLFAAYRHILQMHDLILVPAGAEGEEVYKVALAQTGGKRAVPVVRGDLEPAERFVTRIFTLQHASPRNLFVVLAGMASSAQNVLAVEEAGVLIVTDYDSNLRRLEEMIQALDVKRPDLEMKMVPLKNASAAKVQEKMNELVRTLVSRRGPAGGPGVPGAEPAQVVADERTNAVLLLAEPGRLVQLEGIARRLDAETPYESSGIHFVALRHRNAVDVARTLNAMYRVITDEKGVASGGPSPQRPAAGPGPAAPPSAPAVPVSGGEPIIVADADTNAIILITDRTTFRTLEPVIRRLDRRRPQVHVKATVVEVAATEDFDFGVELARLEDPKGRLTAGGRSAFGLTGATLDPVTGALALTPVLSPGATLLAMKDRAGNIPALLHALEGKAKITVLDEPEATTDDNGAATMTVTTDVPVAQTTFAGPANGFAQAGFKYESAVTTLSISPHISEGGYLRLETNVRIQKFSGPSTDPQVPPGRGSREITTKEVLVPSGGSMVIGGIVTADQTTSLQGVPILSHVPLLGALFRRETESRQRRTLYIFITATILYDDAFGDFRELSRERKGAIDRLRGEPLRGLQVGPPSPRLPESTFRFQAIPAARPK